MFGSVSRLEDGASCRGQNLEADGQCKYLERRNTLKPLPSEHKQHQIPCHKVQTCRQREADKSHYAEHLQVRLCNIAFILPYLREHRMHHRSNDIGDVLKRQEHKPVGLVIISQNFHTHIFTHQELIEIAAEVIDELEQELIQREGGNLIDERLVYRGNRFERILEIIDDKQNYGASNRIDQKGVNAQTLQSRNYGNSSAEDLDGQGTVCHEREALCLHYQGIGHHIG